MFDISEYLQTLQEQEKACRGMADCIQTMIDSLESGDVYSREMENAFLQNLGYRAAMQHLVLHEEQLWNVH